MELINHTGVPAELRCSDRSSEDEPTRTRAGAVFAKATFAETATGELTLDTQTPLPLLTSEEPVALGILPRDTVVRLPGDTGVDIMVLGHACAASGTVEELEVRFEVGARRWAVRVTGHREYVGPPAGAVLTPPTPFSRMPLTWDRTYGGSADVWVDQSTVVPVSAPWNRHGRGYDTLAAARQLTASLGCPPGFPRTDGSPRLAPNVEDPEALLADGFVEAKPYCWAPMPLDLELRGDGADSPHFSQRALSFSHPKLQRIPLVGQEDVRLEGVHGGVWAFALPPLRVSMEYEIEGRFGALPLALTQLILFPDERRVALSYQTLFKFRVHDTTTTRSARLRIE